MKKTIGLLFAVILLVSMIGTALAECNHSWFTVSTTTKVTKETVAYPHGCIIHPYSHTHERLKYETTVISVCSKGCGKTKTVTTVTYK